MQAVLVGLAVLAVSCGSASQDPAPGSAAERGSSSGSTVAGSGSAAPKEPLPLYFTIVNETLAQSAEGAVRVTSTFGKSRKLLPLEANNKLRLKVKTSATNRLTIGEQTVTAEQDEVEVDVDLAPAVRAAMLGSPIQIGQLVVPSIDLPVTVAATDGGTRTGTISVSSAAPVAKWLAALESGPLLLDGETKGPSKRRSAIVVLYDKDVFPVVGTASTFADIDLVAVELWELREKKCGPYVDSKGGNNTTIDLRMWDKRVKLFDRRAGTVVGTKEFLAKGTCPKTIDAAATSASSDVPDDAILKWVAGFVKA